VDDCNQTKKLSSLKFHPILPASLTLKNARKIRILIWIQGKGSSGRPCGTRTTETNKKGKLSEKIELQHFRFSHDSYSAGVFPI
jgi:hypothetical protein